MPTLAPPPYQSIAGSLKWQAWYRQINDLLEGVSISIDFIDDVALTSLTDDELLVSASGIWINQTMTEFGIVKDTSPELGGDLAMGAYQLTPNVGIGIASSSAAATLHVKDSAQDVFLLTNTLNSAASGPIFKLTRDRGQAGVVNDNIGAFIFKGFDDAATPNELQYAAFRSYIDDASEGAHVGRLGLTAANGAGGSATTILTALGTGRVGIGSLASTFDPDGTLHVHTGSAGAVTADSNAKDLVIESSTTGGLSILTPDAETGRFLFGHPADASGAGFTYTGSTGGFRLGTFKAGGTTIFISGNGTEAFRIDSSQHINLSSAAGRLDRNGHALHGPTTSVTAATHTHVAANRYLLCDTTSNAITVNLIAAATAGDGARLDIKIVNATNAVTIDGSGSETIDGATTLALTTLYDNASLVCDGSNWHIL